MDTLYTDNFFLFFFNLARVYQSLDTNFHLLFLLHIIMYLCGCENTR